METTDSTAAKGSPRRAFYAFRPIDSLEDALDAQRAGAGLGVLMAVGYGLQILLAAFAGEAIYGDTIDPFFYVINGLTVVVTAFMALWVWKRRSLIGTVLLTAWFLFEIGFKIANAPETISYITYAMIYLGVTCMILAFRGHHSAARFRKVAPPDTQVFS